MYRSWTLAVITCVLQLTTASPAKLPPDHHDQHQVDLKEHYDHLAYIADFKCHEAQPRVIPVHELFSKEEIHGKAYFPDVTVLHICEYSTGCCTSGHWCQPLHVETVHLPFKITFLEDIEHHKKGSWIMEYHLFENHTECHCAPNPPPPKECPHKELEIHAQVSSSPKYEGIEHVQEHEHGQEHEHVQEQGQGWSSANQEQPQLQEQAWPSEQQQVSESYPQVEQKQEEVNIVEGANHETKPSQENSYVDDLLATISGNP